MGYRSPFRKGRRHNEGDYQKKRPGNQVGRLQGRSLKKKHRIDHSSTQETNGDASLRQSSTSLKKKSWGES